MRDYKLLFKAKLEARTLIIILELKYKETLFSQVTQRQLLDHLQSI